MKTLKNVIRVDSYEDAAEHRDLWREAGYHVKVFRRGKSKTKMGEHFDIKIYEKLVESSTERNSQETSEGRPSRRSKKKREM